MIQDISHEIVFEEF